MKTRRLAMLAPERRQQILSIVIQNKSVLVKDLCAMFDVTGETIRKDLSVLETDGKLLKTYGGAYVCDGVKNELPASIRETVYPEIKDSIGMYCAATIKNGDTILLDESTTSCSIARRLCEHTNLTVLTNSLKIAQIFSASAGVRLILSGGELDQRNQCFIGHDTERVLNKYYVDKCFVSCRGLDIRAGITDGGEANGSIRRIMLERARERFLVVDHSKLNLVNFYKICYFDLIDTIVIDQINDDNWMQFLEGRNIKIIETRKEG